MSFRILTKAIDEGIQLGEVSKEMFKSVERAIDVWVEVDLDRSTQIELSGRSLKRRTGALAREAVWKKSETSSGYEVYVESKLPYASIQEHGGIIRARSGSWLTVPLPAALTPVGVVRQSAREYSDAFVITSKAGNKLIVRSSGDQIIPLFVLKKQVEIKPSHWATNSLENAEPMLGRRIEQEIQNN